MFMIVAVYISCLTTKGRVFSGFFAIIGVLLYSN